MIRDPDLGGLSYYSGKIQSALPLQAVSKDILASEEYPENYFR
jgi:hypothetical protein